MVAEDVVQNVFLKLYDSMDTIRNKDSIKYWLFTTTRNEILTLFRSKKVKADQFNASDVTEIEIASNELLQDKIEKNELKEIILNELEKENDEQREVFFLKEYGGMSYKEISELMNISEDLVKSRLYNTRQRLINRVKKIIK